MPGPIDSLRFAHTAIVRELTDLDRLASAAASPADASALAARFAFLERFSDGHTKGEELGLFPALDEKLPRLSATYLFDHVDERAAFARIREALERLEAGDTSVLGSLRREVTSFADHVGRHIRKENELILPLVHEHFSAAEQAAMVGKIVSVFSPADMATVVPFIVAWLDAADRVRYVSVLAQAVPAPAFEALAARIRERLPEENWAELRAAVPALPGG